MKTESTQVTIAEWMKIPTAVRTKIRQVFNINSNVPTFVQNIGGVSTVISDGLDQVALDGVVTIESLQKYANTTSKELSEIVAKIQNDIDNEAKPVVAAPVVEDKPVDIMPGLKTPVEAQPLAGLKKRLSVKKSINAKK